MPFELTILGSGSATPTLLRNPSAQALKYRNEIFLIDCGEGTQLQCLRYGIKTSRIGKIFISHLHADHCLGLLGLLSTLSLLGRNEELSIYGPAGLSEMIDVQTRLSKSHIPFPIRFHELQENGISIIYEDNYIKIESLELSHRLPCWGFIFREKHPYRKINKVLAKEMEVPVPAFKDLVLGNDYIAPDGKLFLASELTYRSNEASYAYITDTLYREDIALQLPAINVLYHEATFLDDKQEKAKEHFHSTARQAARFALLAKARQLIIGHFSARYKDLFPLLEEAREIFPETSLAEEGKIFYL